MHELYMDSDMYRDRIQELKDALKDIRDNAYSPREDDWIWMKDDCPLSQYIDMVLGCP